MINKIGDNSFECDACGTIYTCDEAPEKCSACFTKRKKEICLPGDNILVSTFTKELIKEIKDKNTIFYRESSMDVLEIGDIKDKENEEEYIGFMVVKPERFITLTEKYITPIEIRKSRMGDYTVEKSMNSSIAKTVLMSEILQKGLPKIKRIFTTAIPIIHNNKLTFPKLGYDPRFSSWTPYNAPKINTEMPLEEALTLIETIFKEFCFQDKQDYTNAVAGLITPFLRGLFPSFTTRTPVFIYMANRERAGKDYCADITGLVMEGHSLQEPPICSGENNSNNNEELRKKILSAMIAGRKRLHFANNKGYIDNAVFEGIITSPKYSDRALGRNEMLTFDNEIDFSLSGNVGIGFTADLANRSRLIRLFLDIEDANLREFTNPNLHAWILDNREKVISALYALVRNWFEQGMPEGTVPFSSFPDWAKICGGIMECAGFDNPCKTDKVLLAVGGDSETQDMKTLFEMAYEKFGEQWINKQDIRALVLNTDEPIFGYLDFNKKADQTKFGMKIQKFCGRTFSNISLKIKDENIRSARQEFMFTLSKQEKNTSKIFEISQKTLKNGQNVVTLVTHGNLSNPSYAGEQKLLPVVDKLPTLPRLPKTEFDELQEQYKKEGLID